MLLDHTEQNSDMSGATPSPGLPFSYLWRHTGVVEQTIGEVDPYGEVSPLVRSNIQRTCLEAVTISPLQSSVPTSPFVYVLPCRRGATSFDSVTLELKGVGTRAIAGGVRDLDGGSQHEIGLEDWFSGAEILSDSQLLDTLTADTLRLSQMRSKDDIDLTNRAESHSISAFLEFPLLLMDDAIPTRLYEQLRIVVYTKLDFKWAGSPSLVLRARWSWDDDYDTLHDWRVPCAQWTPASDATIIDDCLCTLPLGGFLPTTALLILMDNINDIRSEDTYTMTVGSGDTLLTVASGRLCDLKEKARLRFPSSNGRFLLLDLCNEAAGGGDGVAHFDPLSVTLPKGRSVNLAYFQDLTVRLTTRVPLRRCRAYTWGFNLLRWTSGSLCKMFC